MVKVIVGRGANSREFQLHKDLLCISSEFFDAMFNGSFTEAQQSVATLPEDDPEVFSKFAAWIYREVIESNAVLDAEHYMEERINLFAFAEKYRLDKLMDDIMGTVCYETAEFNLRVTIRDIEHGYRHTHENSKMRLYLSRNLAYSILEKKDVGDSSTCKLIPDGSNAQEILLDAMKAMRSPEGQPFYPTRMGERFHSPNSAHPCDYHQHGSNTACPYPVNTIIPNPAHTGQRRIRLGLRVGGQ